MRDIQNEIIISQNTPVRVWHNRTLEVSKYAKLLSFKVRKAFFMMAF